RARVGMERGAEAAGSPEGGGTEAGSPGPARLPPLSLIAWQISPCIMCGSGFVELSRWWLLKRMSYAQFKKMRLLSKKHIHACQTTSIKTNCLFFLFRCETCSGEDAKYRCPRCMKYSCSLACVKKHKTAVSCNGIRDKAAFVSINEFSKLNLLSDYRFLEDVGRMTDSAARDVSLHRPTTNKFINYLKNRARKHNIHLKTLPIGFTKRRENSTCFNKKEQKFYWHLKLVFPHSHAEFTIKRVPEDQTLGEILKPYLDPEESDPVIRQRLKIYTISPQSDVQILMKIENRQHNSVRYDELDARKSILDNLKDKVVIEYPTLHVVLKKLKNNMVVLGQGKHKFISCYVTLRYFN
uniref:Box C/D snoRNA protein 1 n=1 Tax=Pelusios castaneus TaxID=367368 RepID=A0A8C8RCT5_9SAUR